MQALAQPGQDGPAVWFNRLFCPSHPRSPECLGPRRGCPDKAKSARGCSDCVAGGAPNKRRLRPKPRGPGRAFTRRLLLGPVPGGFSCLSGLHEVPAVWGWPQARRRGATAGQSFAVGSGKEVFRICPDWAWVLFSYAPPVRSSARLVCRDGAASGSGSPPGRWRR